jgi:hypothetical protein
MKEFDLEAALRGEPVVTRDGSPVKIAGYNKHASEGQEIAAWIGGFVIDYDKNGRRNRGNNQYDLFMAPKERKEWVIRFQGISGHAYFETRIFDTLQKAENFAQNKNLIRATIHQITITE